ncbi:NAD(P)-dependent oxidoreductase, partial [Streptococcus iniae]
RTVSQNKINGIINICNGFPESLANRVEKFIIENKLDIELEYGVFPDRPYDSKAVWGNSEKLKSIKRG